MNWFSTLDEGVQVKGFEELQSSNMVSRHKHKWSGDFFCSTCQRVGAHFPFVPPWHSGRKQGTGQAPRRGDEAKSHDVWPILEI
jgi:hypothetical protein